jgi:hypothetical protein
MEGSQRIQRRRMKIKLEPTITDCIHEIPRHAVTIEHPHDELNVNEAVELMASALVAWGYSERNVREAMGLDV